MPNKMDKPELSIHAAFAEHKGVLAAYMAKYMLKPEDADDILQDTFLKTLEASQKRDIQSPKSYLFIVARNLIFRKLRKTSKHMMQEIEDIDERYLAAPNVPADVSLHSKMKMEAFITAANQLPAQCRKVFLMRKIIGMSHKEIAAELDISTSTVERHITNAIQRCRNNMAKDGYDDYTLPVSTVTRSMNGQDND